MAIAFCPDCEEGIGLGLSPKLGQRVTCPHCHAELEVIDLSPLELDWVYDDSGEDWDDEVWDDEEEYDEDEDDEEEDEEDEDLYFDDDEDEDL
jgi:lysine biosynthesis protein LysW